MLASVSLRKLSLVLLSYPEKNFGEAKVLRVFISTHTELTAQGILNIYAKRWNIEVFFQSCKQKLAFDKYQLREKQGITRMWLIFHSSTFCAVQFPGVSARSMKDTIISGIVFYKRFLPKMPSQRK